MKDRLSTQLVRVVAGLLFLPILSTTLSAEPTDAINRVPYISTYYVTPKANISESVVINYYVTRVFRGLSRMALT